MTGAEPAVASPREVSLVGAGVFVGGGVEVGPGDADGGADPGGYGVLERGNGRRVDCPGRLDTRAPVHPCCPNPPVGVAAGEYAVWENRDDGVWLDDRSRRAPP